ncbi:MAG: cobalamin B12-binding domain-containing protein [Planctomycetes bacterium]|nr:cobalamin B12-binding domain-containing protein [Planctomycetota bacterium]
MDATRFAAEILSASSSGLARLAAERVVPALANPAAYGSDAFQSWRQHLAGRLADLSLALAENRGEWFAEQVGWAKVAFRSRGAPESDLLLSLRALRDVLASELPSGVGEASVTCLDDVITRFDRLGTSETPGLSTESGAGRLASQYVLALLEGDRRRACDLVLDAVRAGDITPQDAIVHVGLSAQRELGRMWHLDEVTIAEEHFVSATTVRLMEQVLGLATCAPSNGKTVLAAALDNDVHDIGLRAVTDLFELDGWRVIFLGAQMPVEDLLWASDAFKPDLVVLSATLGTHVRSVAEAIAQLRLRRADPPPVLVGGTAFLSEREAEDLVGADAVVMSAGEALPVARRLVGLDDAGA